MRLAVSGSLETQTIRKLQTRIIPFVFILFIIAALDRNNIGFAALTMNAQLGIDPQQYGLIAESWPYGLTYRRDLFEKFGLGRDFKIETWEDLYLAAMVCTRDLVNPDGSVQHLRGMGLFNFGVSGWGDRQFFSFLVADGGDVMHRDTNGQWRVAYEVFGSISAGSP